MAILWPEGELVKIKWFVGGELVMDEEFVAELGKATPCHEDNCFEILRPGLYDMRVELYQATMDPTWHYLTFLDVPPLETWNLQLLVVGYEVSHSQDRCELVRGGETRALTLYVSNRGNDTMRNSRILTYSANNLLERVQDTPGIAFADNILRLGDIAPGENVPVQLEVAALPGAGLGTTQATLTLAYDDFKGLWKLHPFTAEIEVSEASVGPPLIFLLGSGLLWWFLLYFLISAILAAWVYRDSKGRRMKRKSWTGLVFLTSVAGLVIYFKKRKHKQRRARLSKF